MMDEDAPQLQHEICIDGNLVQEQQLYYKGICADCIAEMKQNALQIKKQELINNNYTTIKIQSIMKKNLFVLFVVISTKVLKLQRSVLSARLLPASSRRWRMLLTTI